MYVAEIFESFHGEVNGHHQGRIVTFIRLSGCNLKCSYCDTKHTQDPLYGENMSIFHILEVVRTLGHKHICLTGGEPLLYKSEALELLNLLWSKGHKISVETNGTIDITPFYRYVESFVIDYKIDIPDYTSIVNSNFESLRSTDVIKFVVANEEEVEIALNTKALLEASYPDSKAIFAFSPITPGMQAKELATFLIKHKIRNSVLSLQIHKIIGLK